MTQSGTLLLTDPAEAAELIAPGGLVALPTETVYGLAADARNPAAVARIFEAKQRPSFDPLIVHVADAEQAAEVAEWPGGRVADLAAAFWPGPLTIVLPRRPVIPDLVTSGLSTVGVRVPAHPLAREVIRLSGCPVAAPSANPFSRISPTTAKHVLDGLGGRIDAVLDGGPCTVGIESTIVAVEETQWRLLRPGGVSEERLQAVLGLPPGASEASTSMPGSTADDFGPMPAPGMLDRHYSPSTRLHLLPPGHRAACPEGLRAGLMTYGSQPADLGFSRIERLAENGDPAIAAVRLFAAMRDLDAAGLDVIIAHQFEEAGLGRAINDRLRRASCRAESATHNL